MSIKHDWQELPPDDGDEGARICRICRVSQDRVSYERMQAGYHRWNGKRWELVTHYDPNAVYFGRKVGKKWSPAVGRCKGRPVPVPGPVNPGAYRKDDGAYWKTRAT